MKFCKDTSLSSESLSYIIVLGAKRSPMLAAKHNRLWNQAYIDDRR